VATTDPLVPDVVAALGVDSAMVVAAVAKPAATAKPAVMSLARRRKPALPFTGSAVATVLAFERSDGTCQHSRTRLKWFDLTTGGLDITRMLPMHPLQIL
jgi:hypothetical protein